MTTNDYSITPDQVLTFLGNLQLPVTIEINHAEHIIDVPLFISINLSRMYCGSAILERSSRKRMLAMAALLETFHLQNKNYGNQDS